ncbi:MAG TPA: hypothetical protein VHY08_11165 [Bacillota bacterium]|nr:hypothetical protein [Bacillota bacterium]
MNSQKINLFTTKADLRDVNHELKNFASLNGIELSDSGDPATAQSAIFVLSQCATDDFENEKIVLTDIQKAYIDLVARYNNTENKEEKPAIYLFIRTELYIAFNNWEKKHKDVLETQLRNPYESHELEQLLIMLETTRDHQAQGINESNEYTELLTSIQKLPESFLHIVDDGKSFGLRCKQALLLFLFISIHLSNKNQPENKYSNNWITTFNNVVDLKEKIKFAIFPPRIVLDFQKALTNGALPILTATLQRFESITEDRYELYIEVVNAGKTPVFPCSFQTPFLELYDKQNDTPVCSISPKEFAFGLPSVLASGERRALRLLISGDFYHESKEYFLIFRYRSLQSFNIQNRFTLELNQDLYHSKILLVNYEEYQAG